MRPSSYQPRPISPRRARARWRRPCRGRAGRSDGVRGRVDRDLVGAVPVEQAWCRKGEVVAVHDRNRDLCPVRCRGPGAVGAVSARDRGHQHRLLLEECLLTGAQIDLQHARGCHERSPAETQRRRIGLGVGPEPRRRRALGRGDDPPRRGHVGPERIVGRTGRGGLDLCLRLGALARARARREASTSSTRTPGRCATNSRHERVPMSGAASTRKSRAASLVDATNQPGPWRRGRGGRSRTRCLLDAP